MPSVLVTEASAKFSKARPEVRPGYTVRVHERIQEGAKERVQIFEGLVISVHKGDNLVDTTFTVRRIASGVGVEKLFPMHGPKIEKIEVKKVAQVRRAKLFFLRGRRGKAARLSERFTNADEFGLLTLEGSAGEEEVDQEVVEEAPVEVTETEESKEAAEATGEKGAQEPQVATEEVVVDEAKKEE